MKFHLFRLACLCLIVFAVTPAPAADQEKERIVLRAWGVPDDAGIGLENYALINIIDTFQKKFPHIQPVSATGLSLMNQSLTRDVVPMMQIAGDIAPHVMFVNFRQSDTYIRSKFLYPLDKYIEHSLGLTIKDGHLLELDDYLARLRASPHYAAEISDRVPRQCWQVMRRECPYEDQCPYLNEWNESRAKKHFHVWCYPQGVLVNAVFYRRDMLREAGLPDRAPYTNEELYDWAKTLTNPKENRYGLQLFVEALSYSTLGFLYSNGGRLVAQDADGNWRCVFDSEEAVNAYYFVARLFMEPFENKYGKFTSVVYTGESRATADEIKSAMFFGYLDQRFLGFDPSVFNFGPQPKGPTGLGGAEFNALMMGIYAGIEDRATLDAAWKYIHYYDGLEARQIRTKLFVENGQGRFVQASLLRAGGYTDVVRQVPPGWEEANREAVETGIPEPYGRNCQQVYAYASKAVDQIRTDSTVRAAIQRFDEKGAKARIRQILKARVAKSNEKMLNILPESQRRFRGNIALAVTMAIFLIFCFVFYRISRLFGNPHAGLGRHRGNWQFSRYKWAYLLMLPAIGSILLWSYYPLVRGSLMAFQDYNVRGFSRWTGMQNFADVLFDDEFWYAMWISLKYTFLFMLFGFTAPIALAFLLAEVPRGKVFFRTIYYLPAVLSGIVVIFLWRGFYAEFGMINGILNFFVTLLNYLPGIHLAEFHNKWLEEPTFALLCCLLPSVWAGMGPGCLIYLAALKTIPDDLYEAADIDGASIRHKVFLIAIPSIRSLIIINFIGAVVGVVKGGGEMILAMTGGGPYTPYGQTEVVGLHIFWQAFGYLRFGSSTAMAWVLGSLLIGFTVVQLQRLSRMEFRTTGEKH